jgi:DNA-binding CsgD family transcriptional regulator
MSSDFLTRGTAEALLPIYDAMTDASRWSGALGLVATSVGAVGGGLYTRRIDDRPYDFSAMSHPYTAATLAEYKAHRFDELEAHQWEYLSRRLPLEIICDDETGIPREELERREDYRFNRDRWGIGRRLGVRLNAIPSWYDAAVFVFGKDQSEVPALSYRALRPLLPHLAKAVEVGRAFAMLRERYRAALSVLDHVMVGLAVALPSGELIVHNAEARRIFSQADGLALGRDGRLICREPDLRRGIDFAIARAAGTLRGIADCPESLHLVPRPSGAHAYLLEIAPLADQGGEIEPGLEGALVTIVDPDNVPPTSVRRFAELHGLTPAEAEVCALLVEGATRDEIAERRGTTPETAKQQIKSLMRKCDAHQRGQLIRLIFRTLPPVR